MNSSPETPAPERPRSSAAAMREANDAIWRQAARQGSIDRFRVICECDDPECTRTIVVTVNEYLRRRSSPLLDDHHT